MGETFLKIYFNSYCWSNVIICIMKKGRLYRRAQGFNDLISTSFYEFTGKNNEALVPIKAFLTFSPTKSCLGDLSTLRQRIELLQVRSVNGGFITSLTSSWSASSWWCFEILTVCIYHWTYMTGLNLCTKRYSVYILLLYQSIAEVSKDCLQMELVQWFGNSKLHQRFNQSYLLFGLSGSGFIRIS